MKNLRVRALIIIVLAGMAVLSGCKPQSAEEAVPHSLPTAPLSDDRVKAIDAALQELAKNRQDVMAFIVNDVAIDRVNFSTDGSLGLVWLNLIDRDSKKTVVGETGLAIATKSESAPHGWKITLQADQNWDQVLAGVPADMMDPEIRTFYTRQVQEELKAPPLTGYRLPWEAGTRKRVTGSIGHVFTYRTCPDTCLYAFDFADGTNFRVVAAKGGRVKTAIWRYPNNFHEHANYLLLEDTSTSPTTYQIYYHLAQDSIPEALRVPGAEVLQGQFIGLADNTGPSSGSHLHFMVHAYAGGYWGKSVDITFDDVTDNGGRPRACSEAAAFPSYGSQCQSGDWYYSHNGDSERPTGGISSPVPESSINTRKFNVSAWGKDDTVVSGIQLWLTWDGTWRQVATAQGGSLKTALDVCKLGVPMGQFFIAVTVQDKSGKTTNGRVDMTTLENQVDCRPPTPTPLPTPTQTPTPEVCEPGADQVALYTGSNFNGRCMLVGMGSYPDFGALKHVGSDNLESIKVGSDAAAVLFDLKGFRGKRQNVVESVDDLASLPIGRNSTSSIKVISRPQAPSTPVLAPPLASLAPLGNHSGLPTNQDALTLNWQAGDSASEYRSTLSGPDGFARERDWAAGTSWKVGKLPLGEYTWDVQARNPAGESQAELKFTIIPVSQPPTTHLEALAPESPASAVLLKWTVDSGVQDLAGFHLQYREENSDWKDWDSPLDAKMRQVWFIGKLGMHYQFRLQGVNQDGGAEAYAKGGEVTTTIQDSCQKDTFELAGTGDNSWEHAATIDINQVQEHNFCVPGDEDWLVFPAQRGRKYQINLDPAGTMAGNLQLYGKDHTTLIAEQSAGDYNQPIQLQWTPTDDGLYYVRMRPLYAGLAGSDVRYHVDVQAQSQLLVPGLACSGLLLPGLWAAFKLYKSWQQRKKS